MLHYQCRTCFRSSNCLGHIPFRCLYISTQCPYLIGSWVELGPAFKRGSNCLRHLPIISDVDISTWIPYSIQSWAKPEQNVPLCPARWKGKTSKDFLLNGLWKRSNLKWTWNPRQLDIGDSICSSFFVEDTLSFANTVISQLQYMWTFHVYNTQVV